MGNNFWVFIAHIVIKILIGELSRKGDRNKKLCKESNAGEMENLIELSVNEFLRTYLPLTRGNQISFVDRLRACSFVVKEPNFLLYVLLVW